MWLVNTTKDTSLELFLESQLPPYAILSHTWDGDEVSFQDMQSIFRQPKQGWSKIRSACEQAEKDGFHYLWADTCCIDKTSSAELQEAINSMFRWYEKAAVCYVYLSDVRCPVMTDSWAELQAPGDNPGFRVTGADLQRWKNVLAESRWFTRGWTLQELIAPKNCVFYNVDWSVIGTKQKLIKTISQITRVEPSVLTRDTSLSAISVAKRMSWAARRQTSRVEDMAYSLLGIFDVNIPMLYGEGGRAFIRLQEEIIKNSTDQSIFAWESTDARHTGNLLAESPANFVNADKIIQLGYSESFDITNRGLRIALLGQPLASVRPSGNQTWAALNCRFENDISGVIALRLTRYGEGDEYHAIKQDHFQSASPQPAQPWDFDSVKKFGPYSRLAFIKTKHLIHSARSPMNITRKYEPRHSPVVFAIETGEDAGETAAVYPEHIWSVEDRFVNTIKQSRMRAGMLISHSHDERWVVSFGFDQDNEAEYDSLIPHLSAELYTGTHPFHNVCERSESSASPDRADRTILVAKAPSVSLPGQLLASLQRSEIMGTIVYTVRIGFSGRFPELDSTDTETLFLELDAVETQRAVLVPWHQQRVKDGLQERQKKQHSDAERHWAVQDRLPSSDNSMALQLWVRLRDSGLKLRETFPGDGLLVDKDIIAFLSATARAITLGVLLESPDGTLYNLFVYHGYQQHSRMPTERTQDTSPVYQHVSALDDAAPETWQLVSDDSPSTINHGTKGIIAWIHTGQQSLAEMTEAIESCNRGLSLCGYDYHDRSSHPYTLAKVILNSTERLRAEMSQSQSPGSTTVLVDVEMPTPNSTGKNEDAKEGVTTVIAGSRQSGLDLLQDPLSENVVADKTEAPITNFPNRGTDFSTLSGLLTDAETDILET